MNSLPQPSSEDPPSRPVTLGVLTFERDDSLRRAVRSMVACATPKPESGWSLHEILVVDNNPSGSAKPVVDELAAETDVVVTYAHEPNPGIVAARNRALEEASGDILVFIDDDEVALPGWPDGLLVTMQRTGAALVGGPVVSEFIEPPPQWVIDSGFFDLPPQPDGSEPTWLSTCNVAIDLDKIRAENLLFDARYPHGEDGAFSRLAASKGLGLRWSATAQVKEFIEPERTTPAWRFHRHRISTDAWVRVDLDLDPSPRAKAMIVAKAGYRFGQGALTTMLGMATRNEAKRFSGLALIAQARGGIEGLIAHRRAPQPTA